ncbi:drug resistance transporter [Xylariaceae sp. FL1272]|nr:drug resistance transporter [Xylariaceae sp. FL1272]
MSELPNDKRPAATESLDASSTKALDHAAAVSGPAPSIHGPQAEFLSGWRLHTLTVGLCIGIFLVNLEISIVSTSLVSITDDLKQFSQASWVVTAYLLSYTSFMIILAKASDIFGRKSIILISLILFTVFSGGAAASQTLTQLIIIRALQGIGGCGVYALTMVIIVEMVPSRKWPAYLVLVTSTFAIAMVLGPIFGGLINLYSRWIWVFLLNVPGGVIATGLVAISLPARFPYHHSDAVHKKPSHYDRIDFLGAILLLGAMTLHITGFEQAANLFAWTSAEVLAPLLISLGLWITFFLSQWYITTRRKRPDPVLPWRFLQNRVVTGIIVNSFLSGTVSTTCIITIPMRYQTSSGLSPLQAGIRLIPLSLTIQIGAMLVAVLTKRGRLAPFYLLLTGAILELIGCVFMSRGPVETPDWHALYGFEVVTGVGVGLSIGAVTLMIPYAIEDRDRATGTSAVVQFRFLGGATALAIVTAVTNKWLLNKTAMILRPEQVEMIFQDSAYIDSLAGDLETTVRGLFVELFNQEMRILIGFAAAQILSTIFIWQRKPMRLE